jgi:hypothetical protein
MPQSNAKKGQIYKLKTRDFYKKLGYETYLVETVQVVVRGNRRIYKKHDLFGGDVLACNNTETILANSVLGKSNVAKHIKEFEKYPSGGLKRVVVVWEKGWREPLIRSVDDGRKSR